jgi:hypothetical protein
VTEYNLPVRLDSVANLREHWAKKHKRAKAHRKSAIVIKKHRLPCEVHIVRVGKRDLDGDNLQAACKALRDGIASRLGVDDADPRVTWSYSQQRGQYGAIVRISKRGSE